MKVRIRKVECQWFWCDSAKCWALWMPGGWPRVYHFDTWREAITYATAVEATL